ncbi:hypothetical protein SAMN04489762_0692 [Terribacillus saccharophilus]|uniref:Uncharacterized protein n=1 Tax=Terribacillus saccharophilus TaxID=361277 RepID=A0AAX2EC86_9BACI|nr:hypothetical protein SAMN04489762_0692 [Terribacillus saccharophilus]
MIKQNFRLTEVLLLLCLQKKMQSSNLSGFLPVFCQNNFIMPLFIRYTRDGGFNEEDQHVIETQKRETSRNSGTHKFI